MVTHLAVGYPHKGPPDQDNDLGPELDKEFFKGTKFEQRCSAPICRHPMGPCSVEGMYFSGSQPHRNQSNFSCSIQIVGVRAASL